jgi:NADPH2:quinone reductase
MQAVWYEKLGPAPEVLCRGELPDPEPAAGQVLVRVHCSGVNPIDVKRRTGGRGGMSAPRVVPHFDGAGVIEAVGAGVPTSRLGERVWLYGAQWQRDWGTAAERIALPSAQAVLLPEGASFQAGACLGIPALTAYAALLADGPVEGQTVLVTGGAGAVGRYAIQFARLRGAQVIATVSSPEKQALAESAGAHWVVNYRTEDVAARVAEITTGVDRIVEVEFGGNLATSLQVLQVGGTIATYASQRVPTPTVPFYELMYRSLVVRHVLTFQTPERLLQEAVSAIEGWLAEDQLSHHIHSTYPLAETVAAHQAVEQGTVGKVLIQIAP